MLANGAPGGVLLQPEEAVGVAVGVVVEEGCGGCVEFVDGRAVGGGCDGGVTRGAHEINIATTRRPQQSFFIIKSVNVCHLFVLRRESKTVVNFNDD
jgi:hypothetical protein